jgi:protein-disulfide isomerase
MTMKRVFAALAVLLALSPATFSDAADPPAMTREQVETIIRDYLRDHPEVITDALRAGEVKRREAAREQTARAIASQREALVNDSASPVGGAANGDVTVVEFFDYACPHCKNVAATVKQLMRDDPKVRVVYKELPILGEGSMVAARAALAAREQGKYFLMHDTLMAEKGGLTEASIMAVAAKVGLDVARLKTDMEKPAIMEAIKSNYALAQSLGLSGTPAFIVGDEFAPGAVALARLKEMVAKARQK